MYDFLQDEENGGVLTALRLHRMLRRMGFNIAMSRVDDILKRFNGSMKFSDFLIFMSEKLAEFEDRDTMNQIFKVLDHNRDGLVEVERFRTAQLVLFPDRDADAVAKTMRRIFNQDKKYHGLMEVEFAAGNSGLKVMGTPATVTDAKGQAARAGVQMGFRVTKADAKVVESSDDVRSIIKHRNLTGTSYKLTFAFEKVMTFREFCKFGQLSYDDFVAIMRTHSS